MPSAASERVRKFRKRIAESVNHTEELLLAVHGKRRQASLESLLCEQFALNVAVLWEVFVSDVIVAHVADDATAFLGGLRARIADSVRQKFGVTAAKHVVVSLPERVTPRTAPAWIDPKDWNITLKSASDLATRANQVLAAPAAKKFTLSASDDSALIDYTIALRNYLAHRSIAARTLLAERASGLDGLNRELRGKTTKIGHYLKHRVPSGHPRAVVLAQRLSAVAGLLE